MYIFTQATVLKYKSAECKGVQPVTVFYSSWICINNTLKNSVSFSGMSEIGLMRKEVVVFRVFNGKMGKPSLCFPPL